MCGNFGLILLNAEHRDKVMDGHTDTHMAVARGCQCAHTTPVWPTNNFSFQLGDYRSLAVPTPHALFAGSRASWLSCRHPMGPHTPSVRPLTTLVQPHTRQVMAILRTMIQVTMMRGAQSGGVATYYPSQGGGLVGVRSRVVNGKVNLSQRRGLVPGIGKLGLAPRFEWALDDGRKVIDLPLYLSYGDVSGGLKIQHSFDGLNAIGNPRDDQTSLVNFFTPLKFTGP